MIIKSIRTIVSVLFITTILTNCTNTSDSKFENPRITTDFNEDWQFSTDSSENKIWTTVQVPHTVKIEPLVVNDMWQGNAWYEKKFQLGDLNGKKAFLHFEGVMHESDVWLNGEWLTKHKGGYLPFSVDLTRHAKANAENIIRVKVNNESNPVIPPGKALDVLDFSYYGGIYRDVRLSISNAVYITDAVHANEVNSGGVLIHFTDISNGKATGLIKVHAKNESGQARDIRFKATLTDPKGTQTSFESKTFNVENQNTISIAKNIELPSPALWSHLNPQMYSLTIELMANNDLADVYQESTGIRNIILKDDGFFLNGEKTFIRGTNRHQEYPYVGYAISDNAQYRDAVKIKNAGFDMVRLSHYPQDEAFLDACDELGLLVMNCIPGWQFHSAGEFQENSYQDIRDMVRRDRNHPSIVFWEVSLNESWMKGDYIPTATKILDDELPFDDIYSAGWTDHEAYDLFIPARQHSQPPNYWNFYKEGERNVFIAEYGDWEYYAHNAGFNQTAFTDLTEEERTSRQLRGHGEQRLLQQALNFQEAANSNRKGGIGTIGHANWVMFDYNRGYADDLEMSGISDIFRIPKFVYSFYQSQRSPEESYKNPLIESGAMVSIANYWTPNSPTQVRVYSNTEEVAFYLNGELVEKKKPTFDTYSSHLEYPYYVFDVGSFEAGELKAEGFLNDKKVATTIVNTPKKAVSIQLDYDLSGIALNSNQADIIFVYAKVVDKNETIVPGANHLINFSLVSDEAVLIGENPVKAEAGIATVVLRTNSFTKDIILNAKSDGLGTDEVVLRKFNN